MKRVSFIILGIMSFCMSASAQTEQKESKNFWSSLEFNFKSGIGWSTMGKESNDFANYSSKSKGGLAFTFIGFEAEYPISNDYGVGVGLEINKKQHKLESTYSGLSSASSDFTEKTTYDAYYLSVPFMFHWHNNVFPLSVGLVANIALYGSKSYKRTGTGLMSVSLDDTSSIKNFNSPVPSLRIGIGDKKFLYGITGEVDFMLSKNYDNTAFKQYVTTTIFYNY